MKTLNTLIKLHKRTLDGLRRKMGDLENQKAQLQQAIKKLQKELEDEVALGGKQPEMARFFGDFAKRIKKRQEEITEEIKKIEKEMVALNEEIAREFTELKKFEIAKANMQKREREKEKRLETIAFDEIAGQQFQRKKPPH